MHNDTHDASTLEVEGLVPFAQIPRWVIRSKGALSAGAVHLYAAIMTYADNTTRAAFPSRERLAEDMGVSTRSVGTYIKALEDFGALNVTRRRNRRTGNFYANHYTLRFTPPAERKPTSAPEEACFPRREEADDPITTPTTSTTPTSSFTADKSTNMLHPDADAPGTERKPDPISQKFRASAERRALIDHVQAWASGSLDTLDAPEMFASMLSSTFGDDDMLDHLIWDRSWNPPRKASDRYEAAKWFNTFLNEWIRSGGSPRF